MIRRVQTISNDIEKNIFLLTEGLNAKLYSEENGAILANLNAPNHIILRMKIRREIALIGQIQGRILQVLESEVFLKYFQDLIRRDS